MGRDASSSSRTAAFRKLDPRTQARNPVMFVVELGAAIATAGWLIQVGGGAPLGGGCFNLFLP